MPLFSSIVVYRISSDWTVPSLASIEKAMASGTFLPCGATTELSKGWVPVRGPDFGSYLESVAGQWIAKLKMEKKSVPAATINAALKEKVQEIEAATGRKPGRKEKRELKAEIKLDLLPRAFSKESVTTIWLDTKNRFLVIGAGSYKSAEPVVDALTELFARAGAPLQIAPIATAVAPATAMALWLEGKEAPSPFDLGTDLELKRNEDSSCVKYAKHPLELAEIADHIRQGKVPTKLSLVWDGHLSFTLSATQVISKIKLLEVEDVEANATDSFDADVAIMTAELSNMLPALLIALGGEL